MTDVPAGFGPVYRRSAFLDAIGPVYGKGAGGEMVLGLRVEEKHANARGFAHGGVLATLADVSLGYATASASDPPTSLVTTSLTINYVGAARVGDWVESRVEIQKQGSRLAFANCYLDVGGERIAHASGVFLVVASRQ